MTDIVAFKYRAFLSYAHADSRWGKWLHGALERFPIAKDLADRPTAIGPVPKSLRPIFRDRDDFAGGHARVWVLDKSEPELVLRGHKGDVKGIAWSPTGDRLATASLDRTARIWDAESGATLAVLEGHRSGVRTVAWKGDGSLLATGGEDGSVRLAQSDWSRVLTLAGEQVLNGMSTGEHARCLDSARTGG